MDNHCHTNSDMILLANIMTRQLSKLRFWKSEGEKVIFNKVLVPVCFCFVVVSARIEVTTHHGCPKIYNLSLLTADRTRLVSSQCKETIILKNTK